MPRSLDVTRLEAIAQAVCERLDGEWLLIGGALVALWLEPRRVTEDVDIIGLKGTPELSAVSRQQSAVSLPRRTRAALA